MPVVTRCQVQHAAEDQPSREQNTYVVGPLAVPHPGCGGDKVRDGVRLNPLIHIAELSASIFFVAPLMEIRRHVRNFDFSICIIFYQQLERNNHLIMTNHLLLPILSLFLATPARTGSLRQPDYDRRATPVVNASIPAPWSYLGCYPDTIFAPALNTEIYRDLLSGMTETKCINYCGGRGYKYAGLEFGSECHCGNSLSVSAATAGSCNMACSGSRGELCGGLSRLTTFVNTQGFPTINGWSVLGCYSDNILFRALTGSKTISANNTVRNCLSTCGQKGFTYAGVEFGNECYCGNQTNPSPPQQVSTTLCGSTCSGNSSESCGGWGTLNLFNHTTPAPICVQDGRMLTVTAFLSS